MSDLVAVRFTFSYALSYVATKISCLENPERLNVAQRLQSIILQFHVSK